MSLMNLPIEMIDKILSHLSYDQIAKARSVNSTFNKICGDKLNQGFIQLEHFHSMCLKAVKNKLPRRESERKHHFLARHSDILMAIETRLSMLSMTFMKYIEAQKCCFIPGKVIDEGFRVLRVIKRTSTLSSSIAQYTSLPRPHDFLQEYRDISSMAMEHFDDKILPGIREKMKLENPHLLTYHRSAEGSGSRITSHANVVSIPTGKCLKLFHKTKTNINRTHKAVVMLHQNMKSISKKLKFQNILMKCKLNQQRAMIKHLRKELKDTKNSISAMSKDLNRMKNEQASFKGVKRKRGSSNGSAGQS